MLVNRLFPCAEIERVLQWRIAFPHHLYLAATDGLFAQEVGHDREAVSLAQAADDGTDVGHDVVGAEVRVFLEVLFPEVQQMPHVGGGAIPQSLLEEVDGLFHPILLQVKPQLRSIRMCPRDQHDAFFGKVLVLDVLLRAFVRGDDEIQQSVVKVLQHLGIFAKLDNQVEGQGGDILLQGVLKGLEAHAYADGVPLLLRTFVEMLLAPFELLQRGDNEIIEYLSLFGGRHLLGRPLEELISGVGLQGVEVQAQDSPPRASCRHNP